jgi:hypothetical protein
MVVIGAQYVSGSVKNRATRREATVATAVRVECTKTGHIFDLDTSLANANSNMSVFSTLL